ncbi:MAG: 23S rRNA (pseudouridine(1915)-N(3))-methyltransferase RlmH [Candidatus Peregrinibacteria bacterium]|nr:23S rRNA (pseudouridine(1915)-N(3))-methyltransferase RlmH [Candidatus Peregrinibacteria bacterium]
MQRITLLTVGKLKESWAIEGCSQYIDRLVRAVDLAIVELPASKERDPEKQRIDESQRLIRTMQKMDAGVWLLDERGETLTSPQFSQVIGAARDAGRSLCFLLGGSYGVTDALRSVAQRKLRLSTMTLPHELCRVVFLEQLYRAMEILKGSGYHH